jgi:uncharacterized membrane-anchored protein YhcB (DUF1043 family)
MSLTPNIIDFNSKLDENDGQINNAFIHTSYSIEDLKHDIQNIQGYHTQSIIDLLNEVVIHPDLLTMKVTEVCRLNELKTEFRRLIAHFC